MKNLDSYINEKLMVSKNIIHNKIKVSTKEELQKILKERLAKDKDADLNDIDVRQITDMGTNNKYKGLFEDLDPHNIKINLWNVSNVKTMRGMFTNCKNFNCDLSYWDMSKVEDAAFMFSGCKNFNSDLSNWDVSNITDMESMFDNCTNFNCDLSKWDVSTVENMEDMFIGCDSLKNKPSWYVE